MQDEKKYIKYKGITRLPSDHDSFDGELEESINLSITGGELRPVLPPQVIGTLPGEFKFVHKNAGYEHFIYQDGNTIRAARYAGGVITDMGVILNIGVATLYNINAVGNTLIILTSQDVSYCIWKNNSYVDLGSQLPFPVINFDLHGVTYPDSDRSFDLSARINDSNVNWDEAYIWKLDNTKGTYVGEDYIKPPDNKSVVEQFTLDYVYHTVTNRIGNNTGLKLLSYADENASLVDLMVMGEINKGVQAITGDDYFLFPFFLRYAIRLYDGTLTHHSQPFLMLPTKFLPFEAGKDAPWSSNFVIKFPKVGELRYSHPAMYLSGYKDIIASVDIFISAPIYTYDQNGGINGLMPNPYADTSPTSPDYLFGGIFRAKDKILAELSAVGNFYKVGSISIDDLENSATGKDFKVENLTSIVNQEPMSDDYRSHAKIIADGTFTYNHRLHLVGVKEKPFNGFSYTYDDQYVSLRDYGNIKTNTFFYVKPQPFLFYPDTKASEITFFETAIVGGVNGKNMKRLTLTEHSRLNGAFYLDPGLNPVASHGGVFAPISGALTTSSYKDQGNVLFVSGHQNPFVFPAASRVTLPVGKILAVSSNTEAISQGQFGQFPLYAFTDDGIWALEINAEGKYMARQPVSREVATNPRILQMDKMLAYISGKGVTVLSGVNTETISAFIRENNIRTSKISITDVLIALVAPELQQVYNTAATFEEFSAGASLAYDYITDAGRIFVINPAYPFSWVYDLRSKTWSKVLSDYKRVVNNYPDCYVQEGDGKIRNLATIAPQSEDLTRCMFITRPISFNDANFLIRSLAHRGIIESVINVVIYASRNGVDYSVIHTGKDRLLRMHGSGYRYYKLLVIADLKPHESISGTEIDFMVKYANRMR